MDGEKEQPISDIIICKEREEREFFNEVCASKVIRGSSFYLKRASNAAKTFSSRWPRTPGR